MHGDGGQVSCGVVELMSGLEYGCLVWTWSGGEAIEDWRMMNVRSYRIWILVGVWTGMHGMDKMVAYSLPPFLSVSYVMGLGYGPQLKVMVENPLGIYE